MKTFIEGNGVSINENRSKLFKAFLFLVFMLIGAIILSGAVSAAGLATSPQPKFHHDNQNTGQSQYKGPQTNTYKWSYAVDGQVHSSPAIGSDGTIYFGSEDHYLYALNSNGTKLKWKFKTGNYVDSSPAIASDGTIYVGSNDGNFYAINPNGTQKWKYKIGYGIDSSPAIGSDGTIYFSSYENLYALNPGGTQKWNITGHCKDMSPAIGKDGTIYFGGEYWDKDTSPIGALYAVYPNGMIKWIYKNGGGGSPTIGSDGTIYFTGSDNTGNYIFAVSSSGFLKWKYTTLGFLDYPIGDPAISKDGTIYFGGYDGRLYALNPNGSKKWSFMTAEGNYCPPSTPVIGSDGTIYFGGYIYLYALNHNGTKKWAYNTVNGMESSPAIASDGTLCCGCNYGGLLSIEDLIASASPKSGTYNNTIKVTLKMNRQGTIYYTLNGTKPTTSSTRYTAPFYISSSKTLEFMATDSYGWFDSPIYIQKYTIHLPPKVTSTSPINLKTGVSRTSNIAIKFSENIKASIYYSNIKVKNLTTGKYVTITKTISGTYLNIKTSTKRSANTWYQVTIPKSTIKDYAGNNLAANYTFKFKTGV